MAERSFSVGTIGEILQALVTVSGGRQVAGRLSNRLLPVLVTGVRDSDPEVRNNSVFGLGCLAEASGPLVKSYPSITPTLVFRIYKAPRKHCAHLFLN